MFRTDLRPRAVSGPRRYCSPLRRWSPRGRPAVSSERLRAKLPEEVHTFLGAAKPVALPRKVWSDERFLPSWVTPLS